MREIIGGLVLDDKVKILIDWLTFSSKIYTEIQVIENILNMKYSSFIEMKRGRNGYKKGLHFDGITVLFDGLDNMGVCVDLAGTGCRTFTSFSSITFYDLLIALISDLDNYNISRFDVALDETCGLLDLKLLVQKTNNLEFVTKIQKTEVVCSRKSRASPMAISLYFGSRASPMLIRFYDKAKERNDYISHWVRCELQLRDDYALSMANIFLDESMIGENVGAVLNKHLRFIDITMVSNLSINKTSDFWQEYIDTINKITLVYHAPQEYNLDRAMAWMTKQVAPTFSAVVQCLGSENVLQKLKNAAIGRVNEKQAAMINNYKKEVI